MPCSSGMEEYDRRVTQEALERATQLLCGIMRQMDVNERHYYQGKVEGLKEWWSEHQRLDREREKRELENKAAKRLQLIRDQKRIARELKKLEGK